MAAWAVRLSHQAERDVEDILAWTVARFGYQKAEIYAEMLALTLEALVDGPDDIGVTKRDDIMHGICALHVARYGKRGRHYVVFQVKEDCLIEVLRILHDSMDLARHLEA